MSAKLSVCLGALLARLLVAPASEWSQYIRYVGANFGDFSWVLQLLCHLARTKEINKPILAKEWARDLLMSWSEKRLQSQLGAVAAVA